MPTTVPVANIQKKSPQKGKKKQFDEPFEVFSVREKAAVRESLKPHASFGFKG